MYTLRTVLALAFILVLGGCVAPPAEIGTVGSGITGGAPDESAAAVWIVAKVGGRTGYCSGVVVSGHAVLTAAHCAPDGAQLSIFLGSDYNDAAQKALPENLVTVTAQRRHPKYNAARNLNDLAVLVTEVAIPRPPAAISREPLEASDRGAPVRVVGFGQTSATDKTIGRRHSAMTTIAELDSTGLALQGTPSFCFFDSGGPTFMKRGDREAVVGIHSIMESDTCDGKAWDGRVDLHAAFVDAIIAEAEPAPPDAGAPDASGPPPARDAAPPSVAPSTGTGCATGPTTPGSAGWLALVAGVAALVRRTRRRL
jgi:MYXO-CTERM domain-containing protein